MGGSLGNCAIDGRQSKELCQRLQAVQVIVPRNGARDGGSVQGIVLEREGSLGGILMQFVLKDVQL
jgi:hypothetical protein